MNDFMDDEEKINDLLVLNKNEFLLSYSYLTEAEYDNTILRIKSLIKFRKKYNERQKNNRYKDIEKSRKNNLDYYYKNRKEINLKRNRLGSLQRLANISHIKNKAERKIIMEYVELHEEEIREMNKQRQKEKKKIYQKIYRNKMKEAKQ